MPKFGDLISLSTATRAAAGMAVGVGVTMGVQHHMDSSEFSKDPQRTEIREDQQKKMSFEVQQLSKKLEEERQKLETEKQSFDREKAAMIEKMAALQQMQQAMTEQGVQAGVVAVETVQQVAQAKEPADEQPEEPKADVVPMNNAPRRPAVFDGGGNKEKTNDKQNDDSKRPVVFGSSGDVVTIEKGGAVSDAETERLRERERELSEMLRKRNVESKETRTDELRKRNVESKATQTDDLLFEAATGGDDPSNKPDSKKVKNYTGTDTATHTSNEGKTGGEELADTLSALKSTEVPAEVPATTPVVVNGKGGPKAPPYSGPVAVVATEKPKAPPYFNFSSGTPPPLSSGTPPPLSSGTPPPLDWNAFNPSSGTTPALSVKTFTQKLENDFQPALEELEKELKEEAEKKRKVAEETKLLESLAEWHPIAMALKYIGILDDDDKVIEENAKREEEGKEPVGTPLDRNKLKNEIAIKLDGCVKSLKKSSSVYDFNDCMMQLLLAFVTWDKVNEKIVLEFFQERLSSYWLDAFVYFVTTPEVELTKAYETYKQKMIDRIKISDEGYYCSGFPRGRVEPYSSYEECRDNCVDFVVFDKGANSIFDDSTYAKALYQYVSRCDAVATCQKTNLVTLRNDYIMRLAKLLLRSKNASGGPTSSAYRNNLLKSVIEEVTLNCIDKSLAEAEKKRKGEEIRVLIRMNKDSLFKEAAGTKDFGTEAGNIRFIKIVEMALSTMTKKVSKTEGTDWLSHLDADLFSLFRLDDKSTPKRPWNGKWFPKLTIKNTLNKLHKTMTDKKDADFEELKTMVEIVFWQKIKDYMSDITSEVFIQLDKSLAGSASFVSRDKLKKALGNVKEADLKKVLPMLLDHWNTLVKNFANKAYLLEMTATKKDDNGNAVKTTVPMTSKYFEKMMSDAADILKMKAYEKVIKDELEAYAKVKLFPIASTLRQIVIDSRKNNSDTLTVKFGDSEFKCMQESSSLSRGLLKLVLSYSKAKKLVLEGPWIQAFLASCSKDNVKSLTLKGGSFGIGCLGKISTSIDEVTFEGMELKTLEALDQFLYLEKGNILTLRNVTCKEDYYVGEPGAIQDILDNGATVQIEGCSWYKIGPRPTESGTAGAPAGTPTTTTTTSTGSGSSTTTTTTTTDPFSLFGAQKQNRAYSPGPKTNTGGTPFNLPGLNPKPTGSGTATEGGETTEPGDLFAAIKSKMTKKPETTTGGETTKTEDPLAAMKRRLKPKPAMHEGMLNEREKEDFEQKLKEEGIETDGKRKEEALLEWLRQKWSNVPEGQPIPVDVPYCRTNLREVIKAAVDFASTRGTPEITLSGDFGSDTAAFDNTAMADVAKELEGVKKIKMDMKSTYGANIAFQGQLLETMSKRKRSGKTVKTEEIEVSGWDGSSNDSEKVLEAVGDLGLEKFEVSDMNESVLKNSCISTSLNKKGWVKLLKNTKNVSFKKQKMDTTALNGLLNAVKAVGGKKPKIELPDQPKAGPGASKTFEEKLTEDILKETSNP